MLKKFLIGLAAIVFVLLLIAGFKSPHMSVSREIEIQASADKIFPYINNAKKSYEWMPWSEGDSTLNIQYFGPEEGVGAISSWSGKQMGVGRSEVIESTTNQSVKTQLTYTEPFEMSQLAEISLATRADKTLVKWTVQGEMNYFFRLMGLFNNCDKMIGGEFEKGLTKLKGLVEPSADSAANSL